MASLGQDVFDISTIEGRKNGFVVRMPLDSEGKSGKDTDETRISRGCNVLWQGKLRFYDKCVDTIENFREAKYDPKQAEKGIEKIYEEFTESGHQDMLDCVFYALAYFKNLLY